MRYRFEIRRCRIGDAASNAKADLKTKDTEKNYFAEDSLPPKKNQFPLLLDIIR